MSQVLGSIPGHVSLQLTSPWTLFLVVFAYGQASCRLSVPESLDLKSSHYLSLSEFRDAGQPWEKMLHYEHTLVFC